MKRIALTLIFVALLLSSTSFAGSVGSDGAIQTNTMSSVKDDWSWSSPNLLSNGSSTASVDSDAAYDGEGNLHVMWVEEGDYMGSGSDKDIFYKMWNKSAQSWGPTSLITDNSNDDSNEVDLHIGFLGSLFVVWQEESDRLSSGADFDIFYKSYSAIFFSWSQTQLVSIGSSYDSGNPDFTIDSQGNIHVAYSDGGYLTYNHFSTDTSSWEQPQRVDQPESSITNTVDIEVDSKDQVYLVADHTTLTVAISTINYLNEPDGNWSDYDYLLDTGLSYVNPDLEIDQDGGLHVAAIGVGGLGLYEEISYVYKSPESSEWEEVQTVSQQKRSADKIDSLSPDLEVTEDDTVHVAFVDNSTLLGGGNEYNVYYNTMEIGDNWGNRTIRVSNIHGNSTMNELVVDRDGFVHITWEDTYSDGVGTDKDLFHRFFAGTPSAPYIYDIHKNRKDMLVDIKWTEEYTADRYNIYRSKEPIHSISDLNPLEANHFNTYYTDNITSGPDIYYYTVTSVNAHGESDIIGYEVVDLDNSIITVTESQNKTITNENDNPIVDTGESQLPIQLTFLLGIGVSTVIALIRRRNGS